MKLSIPTRWLRAGLCGLLCLVLPVAAVAKRATDKKPASKKSSTHSSAHPASSHHSKKHVAKAATGKTASSHSAVSSKTSTGKHSRGKASHGKASRGKASGAKAKTAKKHGQQNIDSERTRQIQEALIREHYLNGEPSGSWDGSTQAAMQRYQADHGWQAKTVPDSRALIKLGLGPNSEHLLNPESAMTTAPATSNLKTEAAPSPVDPAPASTPQQ